MVFPWRRTWNRMHCFGGEYVLCVVYDALPDPEICWNSVSPIDTPMSNLGVWNARECGLNAKLRLTLEERVTIGPPPSPHIFRQAAQQAPRDERETRHFAHGF